MALDGWRFDSVGEASVLASLVVAALVRVPLLARAPRRVVSPDSQRRLWAKLTLLGIAFLTSLAALSFALRGQVGSAVLLPHALEPLALVLAACLTRFNHLRTRTSSTVLLLFWPCHTIALSIWTRSYAQTFPVFPLVFLKWTVLSLGLLSFALECISPDDALDPNTENPTLTANIFSLWTFAWVTPLLRKGSRVFVTEHDLPPLVPSDESANLGDDLRYAMEKHSSLYTALFIAYGGPYLKACLLKLLQDSLAFAQPFLLRMLLLFISEYQDSKHTDPAANTTPILGYALAVLMFVTSMTQAIILHQHNHISSETGMRVRAGLITAIFKRSFLLSSDERGRPTGDIVNLMSVDATKIQDFCLMGSMAISGPYQLTLAFVSLYSLLGWSAFVGLAIILLCTPLNVFIARILTRTHEQQMKHKDRRTGLMSELLMNIKSIKLYAWENAFIRRVLHVRNELELKVLRKMGIVSALNGTLWTGLPMIMAFGSLATASVFSDRPLSVDVVFPAFSLFMLLFIPIASFGQLMSNVTGVVVSIRRLSEFLHAEELQESAVTRIDKHATRIGDEVLSIRDGEFQWAKNDIQSVLEGINLTVRKGELVGVLGRVGAGKTSLLSAIIGDMQKTEGEIMLSGSIAYAAQNPWLLSSTVRDNILFSHEYDESFYNLVIEACALKHDLAVLPRGDLTEVGEKGITLSGGQRARIALARAVYARADLVLLDDVLAAVDAHVARHVFENVIGPQGLLATKARVLVTNSITYLRQFDQIAYMRRGIILECGSYRQLVSTPDGAIRNIIESYATSGSSSGETSGSTTPCESSRSSNSSPATLVEEFDTFDKLDRRPSFKKAVLAPLPPVRELPSSGLSKEHSERGHVKKAVYLQYIRAASKAGFFSHVLMIALWQASSFMSTMMLRLWGERNGKLGRNTGLMDPYLLGYGLFNLASIVMTGAAGVLIYVLCSLRSSKYLHDSMLDSIMKAPLSFFEVTPVGRVLNLFSRDIYVVDLLLGGVIQGLTTSCATCITIVLVITFSFPPFLLAVVPLTWVYFRATIYYLSTARELQRLDAVSKSPIFTWFSETLSGLSTIRAYDRQAIFTANNARRIDRNHMCYIAKFTVDRWLCVRLECVGSTIVLSSAILAVAAAATSDVDIGLVGTVLSYALNTTGYLNWLVRLVSDMERDIVSVERIAHYTNALPSEAPHELMDKPPAGWPSAGQVEFSEYSMKYRPELDPVLNNISLVIKPKEKIGIVGRTGAGKSSLLLALFRILEATTGLIVIDGVDISKIGLHDLRSAISIVPQSPDMFEGTLRENIDPVGEHQDVDIWAALEHAHLRSYVDSLPEKLDTLVREGGTSLSAGQRQLLCFARALLRKSKILVLDEATSAVDLDTDAAIQEIIQGQLFRDVTILTIAHRLNTIVESDRVLVLERGRVAEFDTPEVLLADKTSKFYSMAFEAGLVSDASEEGHEEVKVEEVEEAESGLSLRL